MATFTFQKPDKVIMIDSTDFEGKFEFRPLEPGYGLTVGNALRRVLLSSLEGFAFTSVKIDNVDHEFTSLTGIVEDVTEIVLNLKQVRLKRQIDSVDNESVSVSISAQEQLKAGDLQKFISGFQVLNPDLVICNMEKSVKLNFELNIEKGRGYVSAEDNKRLAHVCGTCRSGNDPKKSVVDVNCKSHDIKNLYISDASIFPTSGGTNLTLTIIANSLRVADYIN